MDVRNGEGKKGTGPALTVKTFISSELLQPYLGPQSRCTVHQLHLLHVPEESGPAEESHLMIPCVHSYLCPPTVIQVQPKYPSDLPEVDTDGSLSQRATLLLDDPSS